MLLLKSDFSLYMIDRFLEYASVEKRYSAHTITSYRKDLEDFYCYFLETEGTDDLLLANSKSIKNFIYHLNKNEFSKRSINRKLSTLRSFYLFAMKTGAIKQSPTETIASLKFYPEKQIPMSQDEMKELEVVLSERAPGKLVKAIIETLYQTGMRKMEICGLLLESFDAEKAELMVHGKGNKQRIIPISQRLKYVIQAYLNVRTATEDQHLFVSRKGKKLNEKFVYSTVNNYLSLITSKEKKSPHILRHSFATHVLNNGAEISKVKKLMGHSSLASTQVYTNADIEQLKKVFNSAHPRAKKE